MSQATAQIVSYVGFLFCFLNKISPQTSLLIFPRWGFIFRPFISRLLKWGACRSLLFWRAFCFLILFFGRRSFILWCLWSCGATHFSFAFHWTWRHWNTESNNLETEGKNAFEKNQLQELQREGEWEREMAQRLVQFAAASWRLTTAYNSNNTTPSHTYICMQANTPMHTK